MIEMKINTTANYVTSRIEQEKEYELESVKLAKQEVHFRIRLEEKREPVIQKAQVFIR